MDRRDSPETEVRKGMPSGLGESRRGIKEDIGGIYDEKELTFTHIKNNPILKPISEINKSFINFESLINRALWDYEEDKKQIDKMIELNPKYSETIILSKFQSILGHIKQIIHSQDLQKENMKSTINEMIKISGEEYALLQEEEDGFAEGSVTKTEKEEKPEVKESISEDKEENKEKINEEEEKVFSSELLEKDIPTPIHKRR